MVNYVHFKGVFTIAIVVFVVTTSLLFIIIVTRHFMCGHCQYIPVQWTSAVGGSCVAKCCPCACGLNGLLGACMINILSQQSLVGILFPPLALRGGTTRIS